ncbi:TPA: hypothetical protein DDZ10_05020 [Candidatus Uhrbacteria bacterium]|nr:MAG: hypothetical protein UY79_C0004G0023 [Parcubacteria group bacterium GW2011_GWA2_53_21]HBL39994.1 hypothetical protein [Candidatus Uhrbacteria bacterium]
MIWRVLLGLLVIIVGFFMVWKTVVFQDFFGVNAWAERKFGSGGTNTFYKLLGVLVAFLGMLIATNLISEVMQSLVGIFVR